MRTSTFWLITFVFSTVDMGVAGFNLHLVPFISDMGYSPVWAGSVQTVTAATQLGSGLLWGFVGERVSVRKAVAVMFVIEAAGLVLALQTTELRWLYLAFFLYGTGLGGGAGSPGGHVGQLLRPHISRHGPESQRAHPPALRRHGRARLRLPLRLHRQLRPVADPLHRRTDPVRRTHPVRQAAGKAGYLPEIVGGALSASEPATVGILRCLVKFGLRAADPICVDGLVHGDA